MVAVTVAESPDSVTPLMTRSVGLSGTWLYTASVNSSGHAASSGSKVSRASAASACPASRRATYSSTTASGSFTGVLQAATPSVSTARRQAPAARHITPDRRGRA